jgi:hypothetical protein
LAIWAGPEDIVSPSIYRRYSTLLTILAVKAVRNLLYFESITLLDGGSNDRAGEGKSRGEVGERRHGGRMIEVYRRSERLADGS